MRVRIKLYGAYRQQLGQREMEIELSDGATVRSLIEELGITDTVDLWVLLNDVPAERDQRLSAGDTVMLFQPIAGGVTVHLPVILRSEATKNLSLSWRRDSSAPPRSASE